MPKTNEELQEYIHQYKSSTLADINEETQKRFDQSNQIDLKIGNLLITLASAFIAILGGYVLGHGQINNGYEKLAIIITFLLFLISIIAGLKNYQDISKFWLEVGIYKHAEGKIITTDDSKSYNDLVKLREKLDDYRSNSPSKSKDLARAVQISSFLGAILLLLIIIAVKIYC